MRRILFAIVIFFLSGNIYSQNVSIKTKQYIYKSICDKYNSSGYDKSDYCNILNNNTLLSKDRSIKIEILSTGVEQVKAYYFTPYISHSPSYLLIEQNDKYFILKANYENMFFEISKLLYFIDLSEKQKYLVYRNISEVIFKCFDENYIIKDLTPKVKTIE